MLENGIEIKDLLSSINTTIFDIESVDIAVVDEEQVIERLKEVQKAIDETLRYNRPADLPESLAWSGSSDNDYEFNQYVFDGSMSLQDHKRAAKLADEAAALKKDLEDYDGRIAIIDKLEEPKRSYQLGVLMTIMENKYGISVVLTNDHIDNRVMALYNRASSLRNFDD